MEKLIYNSTSSFKLTLGKAFGLPSTPFSLRLTLVPGVNTPPYSHRFKSLVYTKSL